VTIFSNFKQNKPNFFFRSKNPENLRGFCPQEPEMKTFIAFLCDNIWHFQAKLAKKKLIQPQPEMAQLQGFYCVFK
jgi:hypothetical protein